jgi:hypothetical protein
MKSTSELRLGEDVSFISDIRPRMVSKPFILQLVSVQFGKEIYILRVK